MAIQVEPAMTVPVEAQIEAFNQSFEGYLAGDIQLDSSTFATFIRTSGVDLDLSRIAIENGKVLGFAYVGAYAGYARLAGMGVVPEARRQGLAARLLEVVLEQARVRLHRACVLEVFEQNREARLLYQKHGFKMVRRLFGYRVESPRPRADITGKELESRPIFEIARKLIAKDTFDLPYQISGYTLARSCGRDKGYGMGSALVVISDPDAIPVRIRSLVDFSEGWTDARDLLGTLFALYPGRQWVVGQILPEEIGEAVLLPLGFEQMKLNQLQMRLML